MKFKYFFKKSVSYFKAQLIREGFFFIIKYCDEAIKYKEEKTLISSYILFR